MAGVDRHVSGDVRGILQDVQTAIAWQSDCLGVQFSFVSESAVSILGFSAQEWQDEPGFLKAHVQPEDWPELLQTLYRAAVDGGGPYTCQHRMTRRDGSVLWAQSQVARTSQTNGLPALAGITVDVTALKRSEEQLRDREFLSRMLVENLRDYGVFLISADGRVETWSSGAKRLKEYDAEEIIGQRFAVFFPPDAAAEGKPEQLLREAEVDGQGTYMGWMVKKGGSQFWARCTLTVIRTVSGKVRGFSNLAMDLTETRRIEQELREGEEQFRRLVESQDYGVFMVSPEGEIQSWNRGAQRLQGYRAHEILGSPLAQLFRPEDGPDERAEELLAEAERLGNANYEGWLVRKRGETFWGLLTASAVEDEAGELRGCSILARDVTSRRETEDALRESERHFRLLVESVKDYGLFMLSVEGVIESWNQGSQRLKGYRAHEVVGTNWATFFPPDEAEKGTPLRLLEQAATQGSSTYEGWLVRKGGTRFWTHLTLNSVEDENGQLIGLANVARDLTERKETEDALREGEERLRLLVDSLQDTGVFMTSPEGTVTSWSAGAERIAASRSEEMVGQPVSVLFPQPAVTDGTPRKLLERAAAEGRAEYEGWIARANGGTLWGSITISAVRDAGGQIHGYSIVAQDLSARMRAQRTESLLSDASNLLAGSLDQRTTLDRVARLATRDLARWCVVVLLVDEQLQPVAVAHVDPDRDHVLRAAVRPVSQDVTMPFGVASVIRTEQPELKEVVSDPAWVAQALGIEDPEVVRDLGVQSYLCVPLTARGKTFGAIALVAPPGRHYVRDDLVLAQDLSRRAALAIDNARLHEQAHAAVRLREEILAIVSHDLRTPLSTIGLWAGQILRPASEGSPSATTDFAERIQRAARQMSTMILDLVDFSSIETGRLSIDLQPHTADSLLAAALEMLQPIADAKGVHLHTDAKAARGLVLRCDRERILQVLSNIVGNAIKFTEPAGSVAIRLQRAEGRLVFEVTDTGPGIPEEHLPHVFERYWKKDPHARASLGLGLAIAQAIVQSHGSEIQAGSAEGGGARFTFSLPIAG